MSSKKVRPKASTSRHESKSRSIDSDSGPPHREKDARPSYRDEPSGPSYREHASIVPKIQAIPARRFSITPTGVRGTRKTVSYEDMQIAKHWTNDYDNDMVDFVAKWAENTEKMPYNEYTMPLFYRIMNLLLSVLQDEGSQDSSQDRKYFGEDITTINQVANGVGFDISTDIIIKNLIQNILYLYDVVSRFPKASTIDEFKKNKVTQIILYHGFKDPNASIIENINHLNPNDPFITPIFLSTSVLRDVACRFSGTGRILLKIIVPLIRFVDCPYAYLDDSVVLGKTNSFKEHEVLLNLFTKFKYIDKQSDTITYSIPLEQGGLVEKTEEFTIYTMEYVEHSKKTKTEVNKDLIQLVDEYRPT